MTQNTSPETSLETIVNYFINQRFHIGVGKIDKIHNPQLVDVKPLIMNTTVNQKGEKIAEEYSVIPNAVVFIMATSSFFSSMPIAVGDQVLILVSDHSMDKYMETDGKEVLDSEDIRRNDITDAIVIPGIPTPKASISEISTTDMVMGKRDGSALIKITSDNKVKIKGLEVLLGSLTANKALAMAEKVDSRLSALETYVQVPHGSAVGPTIPTPFIAGNSGGQTTGSTKVFTDA